MCSSGRGVWGEGRQGKLLQFLGDLRVSVWDRRSRQHPQVVVHVGYFFFLIFFFYFFLFLLFFFSFFLSLFLSAILFVFFYFFSRFFLAQWKPDVVFFIRGRGLPEGEGS